ncbi:hypothetical protein M8C21_006831 [Ambrosia artemisiifolia]|uniref:Uncharacterized protein n=1 Tax=Ambrosia artemisiifolia TaxID=4212 RepID=A0AAD5D508_AMBAR|nr:hypothetical protein M8C21_006831 [Ambrosia artemisiifolia]
MLQISSLTHLRKGGKGKLIIEFLPS